MSFTFTILILLALGLASALYYYIFSQRLLPRRYVLFALRFAIVGALLAAFFEPVFTFERLKTRQAVVPVLIDASESMRLFRPDSTVLPLLRAVDSLAKGGPGRPVHMRYYCFGDSLRRCRAVDSLRFTDTKSILPGSFDEKTIQDAASVLLVTDGNFSNASFPRGILQEKTCYYLKLPSVLSPQPYLNVELLSCKNVVLLDSPSVAFIGLAGYRKKPGNLGLLCREGSRIIVHRTRGTNAGYFSDTISVRLPAGRQGRFLYEVVATNADDSLRASVYVAQSVVRKTFKAKILQNPPLLDRRFFSLALTDNGAWTIAGRDEKDCDALFAFAFDEKVSAEMDALESRGIVVFVGAMPCSTTSGVSPQTCALVPQDPGDTLLAKFDIKEIPPPSLLLRCDRPFLRFRRTVLSCAYTVTPDQKTVPDTLPFVIVGRYKNHNSVVLSARGLWQMDFWPLSLSKESETPSFLRYLTAFIQQRLLMSLEQNFLAFPAFTQASDVDSLVFSLLLPSDFFDSRTEQPRQSGKNQSSLHLAIESNGKTVFDSSYDCSAFYSPAVARLTCGPLRPGTYFFKSTLVYGSQKQDYADSLHITKNDMELSVQGQNTVMLGQIALPLNHGDIKTLHDLFDSARLLKPGIVIDNFQIKQSVVLLLLCLFLFSLEWLLRRRSGLE